MLCLKLLIPVHKQKLTLKMNLLLTETASSCSRSHAPVICSGSDLTALPFSEAKRRTVESFERSYLLAALRAHDGNVSRTAAAIGMVRQSLQQKIRELDLRSEDWTRSET